MRLADSNLGANQVGKEPNSRGFAWAGRGLRLGKSSAQAVVLYVFDISFFVIVYCLYPGSVLQRLPVQQQFAMKREELS